MFSGFDVEGTLVDSVPQSLRSLQEALGWAGFDVSHATLQLYSGLDGDQTLRIIAPDLGENKRQEILRRRMKIYEADYLHTVRAFGGVHAVFEALTRAGGKVALATDCKGPELKHYLSLLGIDELIDANCLWRRCAARQARPSDRGRRAKKARRQ